MDLGGFQVLKFLDFYMCYIPEKAQYSFVIWTIATVISKTLKEFIRH